MILVGVLGMGFYAAERSTDLASCKEQADIGRPVLLRILSVVGPPPTFLRAGGIPLYFRL